MRALVARAVRLERSGVELGFGARCSAGVAIPLVLAYALHAPLDGVAAAMGAMAAGFASRQGVYRTRAAAMLITSAAMAASAYVGAVAEHSVLTEIVLTALWGVGFGFVGALGNAATVAGLNAVIALIVFGRPPFGAAVAAEVGAYVFVGGAFQTLLLVLVWPLQRFRRERAALAAAYRDLAAYATTLPAALASPAPQSLAAVESALADPQPFAPRSELAGFEALLDEAERIRATLAALATDRHGLAADDGPAAAIEALVARAAPVLHEIGSALAEARAPAELDATWHEADLALRALEDALPGESGAATIGDARTLLAELRTAWRSAAAPADRVAASPLRPRAAPFALTALGDALQTLAANLSPRSVWAQHAMRLGLTLLAGAVLAQVLPLLRGYWVPLTAAILLRPDFTTTFSRGLARAAGTVLGALVASAIAALAGPSPEVPVLVGIAFAWLGYTLFSVNYAIFSLAITCYVVFLLAFAGTPEHQSALDRVAATLIGAALVFGAYGIWPTWSRAQVPDAFADLLDAQRCYARRVLEAYAAPETADAAAIRRAQLEARRARSRAEAAIDLMLAEPVRPRVVDARAARAFLAASRRFGIAALALHARLPRVGRTFPAALATLTKELDGALASLAAAVRARETPSPAPPLRAHQVALKASLDREPDPDLTALVAETDLLVDGVEGMTLALRRELRR